MKLQSGNRKLDIYSSLVLLTLSAPTVQPRFFPLGNREGGPVRIQRAPAAQSLMPASVKPNYKLAENILLSNLAVPDQTQLQAIVDDLNDARATSVQIVTLWRILERVLITVRARPEANQLSHLTNLLKNSHEIVQTHSAGPLYAWKHRLCFDTRSLRFIPRRPLYPARPSSSATYSTYYEDTERSTVNWEAVQSLISGGRWRASYTTDEQWQQSNSYEANDRTHRPVCPPAPVCPQEPIPALPPAPVGPEVPVCPEQPIPTPPPLPPTPLCPSPPPSPGGSCDANQEVFEMRVSEHETEVTSKITKIVYDEEYFEEAHSISAKSGDVICNGANDAAESSAKDRRFTDYIEATTDLILEEYAESDVTFQEAAKQQGASTSTGSPQSSTLPNLEFIEGSNSTASESKDAKLVALQLEKMALLRELRDEYNKLSVTETWVASHEDYTHAISSTGPDRYKLAFGRSLDDLRSPDDSNISKTLTFNDDVKTEQLLDLGDEAQQLPMFHGLNTHSIDETRKQWANFKRELEFGKDELALEQTDEQTIEPKVQLASDSEAGDTAEQAAETEARESEITTQPLSRCVSEESIGLDFTGLRKDRAMRRVVGQRVSENIRQCSGDEEESSGALSIDITAVPMFKKNDKKMIGEYQEKLSEWLPRIFISGEVPPDDDLSDAFEQAWWRFDHSFVMDSVRAWTSSEKPKRECRTLAWIRFIGQMKAYMKEVQLRRGKDNRSRDIDSDIKIFDRALKLLCDDLYKFNRIRGKSAAVDEKQKRKLYAEQLCEYYSKLTRTVFEDSELDGNFRNPLWKYRLLDSIWEIAYHWRQMEKPDLRSAALWSQHASEEALDQEQIHQEFVARYSMFSDFAPDADESD